MKTLALALALAASSAVAQPVVDRVVRAPSPEAAPAPVPSSEAPLPVPDLPVVAPELAARVTSLRGVVVDTAECFTYYGERDEHIADRRCPAWFAALNRGGVAGAHAIGTMIDDDFGPNGGAESGIGADTVRPRILRLMAAQGGPVAATYLVRYLGRSLGLPNRLDNDTARAVLATLTNLAGEDLARVAPWESSEATYNSAERMTPVVQRWLRWHRDVSTLPRAEQLALAAQHNVEALGASDPAHRWVAIERLAAAPAHRPAAVASLRGLLASPELGAEARSFLSRWARRQRIPVPSRAALAAN